MTLPAAFPMSVSNVNVELGRASNAAFSFIGAQELALASKSAAPINMSDWLGKSSGPTFVGFGAAISGSSPSWSGFDIGADNANRRVYVCASVVSGTNNGITIASPVIAGIGAAIDVQHGHTWSVPGGGGHAGDPGFNEGGVRAAIFSANVPTGSPIAISFSAGAGATSRIAVYVENKSPANIATLGVTGDGDNDINGNITVPASGRLLAAGASLTGGTALNLTPGTEQSLGNKLAASLALGLSGVQNVRLFNTTGGSDLELVAMVWN